MKEKFLEMAKREYSPAQRFLAVLFGGTMVLVVIPFAVIYAAALLDQRLGLMPFGTPAIDSAVGGVMMGAGFLWAMWAVYVQFTLGRGTPMPVMATQRLIVEGPYRYSRNPMALGTLLLYLGLAVAVGSYSALALMLIVAALLLLYIRKVEEQEMTLRFGEAYQRYRQQTPFIIPRFGKR